MMKWLLIALVRGYQTFISAPLHALGGPGSGCRYTPSCSCLLYTSPSPRDRG